MKGRLILDTVLVYYMIDTGSQPSVEYFFQIGSFFNDPTVTIMI